MKMKEIEAQEKIIELMEEKLTKVLGISVILHKLILSTNICQKIWMNRKEYTIKLMYV